MTCRPGCAACCIAPSISSPIPGMPHGKPAGVRCVNLDETNLCRIWGRHDFPAVCRGFRPSPENCGESAAQALVILTRLELSTKPPDPLAPDA